METALWLGVDSSRRANHAASDSHVSDRDARQNIRQNTDTTHPAHPNFNVRASNIDIQVGTCVIRSPGRVPPSFSGLHFMRVVDIDGLFYDGS
jgi:hypothetical protein